MNSQGGACHQGRQISSGGRLLGKRGGRKLPCLGNTDKWQNCQATEKYEYEMGK